MKRIFLLLKVLAFIFLNGCLVYSRDGRHGRSTYVQAGPAAVHLDTHSNWGVHYNEGYYNQPYYNGYNYNEPYYNGYYSPQPYQYNGCQNNYYNNGGSCSGRSHRRPAYNYRSYRYNHQIYNRANRHYQRHYYPYGR